jgi:hypothetical protein
MMYYYGVDIYWHLIWLLALWQVITLHTVIFSFKHFEVIFHRMTSSFHDFFFILVWGPKLKFKNLRMIPSVVAEIFNF